MQHQDYQAAMEQLTDYANQFSALVQQVLSQRQPGGAAAQPNLFDPAGLSQLIKDNVQVDTASLVSHHMQFLQDQQALWQQASRALMGEQMQDVVTHDAKDSRFAHPQWQQSPVFSYLRQAYLINTRMFQGMLDSMTFDDAKTAERVRFYTRQYLNSLSPSNYLLSNPEVCEEILKTNGQSMVKGLENFLRDLEQSPLEAFRVTQTDRDAFTVGENLATTPGQVIFQNELMQLIHYTPAGKQQYARPVLFVPPFINKYYILDLNQTKSVVKGLLDEGYAVFMISWVNPDASLARHDFVSYMRHGPLAAMDVVQAVTGQDKINMVGFCVGGTLLSMTAAYLRARQDERIGSLTLLTTLLDFSEQGEVGNYLTEESVAMMENHADLKGIYDGRILGLSFSLLRENNLFWSYFINNYLKGQDPAPFDILYWNSDPTNITAACFKQYLRHTYMNNTLKVPGGIRIDGTAVDLRKIDMPVYFLATVADHIVLWQGAYQGTQLVKGPKRFVLAGSGHLAGVINPEQGGKYPHWVNDALPDDAQQWFAESTEKPGSWWRDWYSWMQDQDATKVSAVRPGSHTDYPAIEPAPGRYVQKQL